LALFLYFIIDFITGISEAPVAVVALDLMPMHDSIDYQVEYMGTEDPTL